MLQTQHQRKSATITAILLLLLLFIVFNFGLRYLDPPEEYGVAINFGDADFGSGEPVENTKKIVTPKVVEKEEVVKEEVKETPKEVLKEEIITQETTEEVPIIEKKKEEKKPVDKVVTKEIPVEKPKPKPKPSKETQEALNSLLNGNSSDGKPKGEGNDEKEGVKGDEKGNPTSNTYYGNTGSGSGGNYNLAGRKALSKPIEQPNCQEEGIVVVRIEVDKNGKVIKATAGVKGSTNTADCLLKPAREAALRTQWNADENAPVKQTGTIIYKFSLTK